MAQVQFGLCYRDGIGVEQNLKEAARLFSSGAENGVGYGRVLLGLCCRHGEGIEQNSRKALEHFRIESRGSWLV